MDIQKHARAITLFVLRALMVVLSLPLIALVVRVVSDLVFGRPSGRHLAVAVAATVLVGVLFVAIFYRRADRPIVREAFWGLIAGSLAVVAESWGRIASVSSWLGRGATWCSGMAEKWAEVARTTPVVVEKPKARKRVLRTKDVIAAATEAAREHAEAATEAH